MNINLWPRGSSETLEVVKMGDVLIVNGESFDFSAIGEGDTLPAAAVGSNWFWDKIERVNGELELTFLLPLPWNYSQAQAFPVPLINVPDGPVMFPQPLPVIEIAPETPVELIDTAESEESAV